MRAFLNLPSRLSSFGERHDIAIEHDLRRRLKHGDDQPPVPQHLRNRMGKFDAPTSNDEARAISSNHSLKLTMPVRILVPAGT